MTKQSSRVWRSRVWDWSRGAVLLVSATAPHALAQSPDVPTIAPSIVPAFEGSNEVRSIAFSPDGESMYVHVHVPAVDLWPNIVALWPEILGGLLAVAGIVFFVIVLRIRGTRQTHGLPYCRKCNYDLSPQVRPQSDAPPSGKPKPFPYAWNSGVLCPECGTGLDRVRPVLGRGLRRRIFPSCAVMLCLSLAYILMFVTSIPRRGRVSLWLDFSSTWVARNSDSWTVRWLSPVVEECDRVVEIEPATGTLVRVVTTRRGATPFNLTLTPDGTAFFLTGYKDTVDAIGIKHGRLLRRTAVPGGLFLDVQQPGGIGFSPDGETAYIQWWNDGKNESGVSGWRWRTRSESVPLARTPGYVDPARNANWPRGFVLRDHKGSSGGGVADGTTPRFLAVPSFMEAFPTRTFTMLELDGSSPPRVMKLGNAPDSLQRPAISADGSLAFLSSRYGDRLLGVDLDSGKVIGTLEVPGRGSGGKGVVSSRTGRYLVAASSRNLVVRDTVAMKWIMTLEGPESLYGAEAFVSPDGRWIAAVCQGGGMNQPAQTSAAYFHNAVVWNLGDLRLVDEADSDNADVK